MAIFPGTFPDTFDVSVVIYFFIYSFILHATSIAKSVRLNSSDPFGKEFEEDHTFRTGRKRQVLGVNVGRVEVVAFEEVHLL